MAHFLGIGTSARRYACAAPSSNNAARTWFCESSAEARIKGEAHSLCAPHDARKAACAKPAFVAHLTRSAAGCHARASVTVSYTHLTLPTILRV